VASDDLALTTLDGHAAVLSSARTARNDLHLVRLRATPGSAVPRSYQRTHYVTFLVRWRGVFDAIWQVT
jgi:hypothetical protein